MKEKILLHCCCGCCAGGVVEDLKARGYDVIAFFCNPNIQPKQEYLKRKEALMKILSEAGIECFDGFVDELYDEESSGWEELVKGLENEPEGGKRCELCFEIRLRETAKAAKTLGIRSFASTLAISPHKNAEMINRIGSRIAAEYRLKFIADDFKQDNGFGKTMNIARKHSIYRQSYCGCRLSMPKSNKN